MSERIYHMEPPYKHEWVPVGLAPVQEATAPEPDSKGIGTSTTMCIVWACSCGDYEYRPITPDEEHYPRQEPRP